MRLTEYLVLIVLIAGVVSIILLTANDLNTIYPDNQITTDNLSQYDYINNVSSSLEPIQENFKTLSSTDTSFFSKIGAGIVAIPYAVITFPILIFNALGLLGSIITGLFGLYLTAGIIFVGITLITIEAIRRLIELFQRSRT